MSAVMDAVRLEPRQIATELRATFARFATGVAVVAYEDDDGVHGLTVNSLTSISLDPPLLLVSIQKNSRSHAALLDRPFTVSVLSADHSDVARAFASKSRDGAPDWDRSMGAPLVAGAIGWFHCTPWARHEAGDHTIVLGEVQLCGSGDGSPLLFYGGQLTGLNG
ncbi:flavin reductase family protein [Microbacterium sp. E-13]|uniref:flavin reductase family protein n=1 Tax=Microbacterium sp. E-13 TaxID=3404048 RepID=UPI003CF20FA7